MRHRAFAVGGSGGWTPLDLSPALWLDADDAAMFTYSSGTLVSQWADKSGNFRHFVQGNPAIQPSRSAGEVNGRPAVRYISGQDLTCSVSMASLTEAEVFLVFRQDVDPPAVYAQFWAFDGAGAANHVPWTDGTIYDAFGSTSRKTVGNPVASLATPRCYNVRSAAGAWSAWLDGVQLFSTASSSVSMGSTYRLGINTNGVVAELIIFDSVLSSTDRAEVQAYLNTKWAVY